MVTLRSPATFTTTPGFALSVAPEATFRLQNVYTPGTARNASLLTLTLPYVTLGVTL